MKNTLISPRFRILSMALMLMLALLSMSCGLKRSNPLDPNSNPDVVEPDPVNNISVMSSAAGQVPRTVTLNWDDNSPLNTSGYYIYRALGYYATFALVDSVQISEFVHSSANDQTVLPGEYYYRISAYKGYPGGNLEGRKSEPLWVYIP